MIPVNWINVAAGLAMASGGAMLLYQLLGLLAGMPAPARPPLRLDLAPRQVAARPRSQNLTTRSRRRRHAQDRAGPPRRSLTWIVFASASSVALIALVPFAVSPPLMFVCSAITGAVAAQGVRHA